MQITVKGKQIDVGDALRGHAEARLGEVVAKYFARPIEAQVVVSRNGAGAFHADVHVHPGRGIAVHGSGESHGDAHAAVEAAIEHVAKQLRRYKRRLKDHGDGGKPEREAEVAAAYVLAREPEPPHDDEDAEPAPAETAGPMVIAEMTTEIATLTVAEAVMRMDLAGLPALMFRNRGHDGLNLVYRRPDGNVGWVDPQGNAGAGGGAG